MTTLAACAPAAIDPAAVRAALVGELGRALRRAL